MMYLLNFGRASTAQEIFDWIEANILEASRLREKERGKIEVKRGEI